LGKRFSGRPVYGQIQRAGPAAGAAPSAGPGLFGQILAADQVESLCFRTQAPIQPGGRLTPEKPPENGGIAVQRLQPDGPEDIQRP
jgi:hypothetical protein